MSLSTKEIRVLEAELAGHGKDESRIQPSILDRSPDTAMTIHRITEIDKLGITPEEALEYALIRNNSWTIAEAIQEHGLSGYLEPEDPAPEDALDYAIDNIPTNVLTTLLNAHGYQPIPKRKQALRDNALMKPY